MGNKNITSLQNQLQSPAVLGFGGRSPRGMLWRMQGCSNQQAEQPTATLPLPEPFPGSAAISPCPCHAVKPNQHHHELHRQFSSQLQHSPFCHVYGAPVYGCLCLSHSVPPLGGSKCKQIGQLRAIPIVLPSSARISSAMRSQEFLGRCLCFGKYCFKQTTTLRSSSGNYAWTTESSLASPSSKESCAFCSYTALPSPASAPRSELRQVLSVEGPGTRLHRTRIALRHRCT